MHSTTSAVDFSKETLVVEEEETYDAGVFERVEAEVVKLLKEPQVFSIGENSETRLHEGAQSGSGDEREGAPQHKYAPHTWFLESAAIDVAAVGY